MGRQTKYSTGDRLIVRHNLSSGHTSSGLFVTPAMLLRIGQEATITRAFINATGNARYGVSLNDRSNPYIWSNSCFEEPEAYTQEIEL